MPTVDERARAMLDAACNDYDLEIDDLRRFVREAAALAAITTAISQFDAARAVALEEACDAQPSTAEDPNESAYQRGRFDGIMEYAAAIRALGNLRRGFTAQ